MKRKGVWDGVRIYWREWVTDGEFEGIEIV